MTEEESSSKTKAQAPVLVDANTTLAFQKYKQQHAESIANPSEFWSKKATELLDWFVPFPSTALSGGFEHGDVSWFAGGKLNVCYNAIDRHVSSGKANDVAMVFEGDEPDDIQRLTYSDLLRKTSQISNALRSKGVRKGDVVTVYMPMIPELPLTMLACARIGAVHSVVFGGFSSEALAARVSAARSKFVVTADQGRRGGKSIPLKQVVDDAVTKLDIPEFLEQVFVYERFYKKEEGEDTSASAPPYDMKPCDIRMDPLIAVQRPYCAPELMDAEDNLFILYTSGSTGQPKGMLHTTGGYALYAQYTTATTFALSKGDLFACVADCGWITGHSYTVYGALLNGSTTVIFESTPVYPNPGRYWDMIQRHKITQFYTAPTAIRLLMKFGDDIPSQYDTSSLKVLGSVGEPINPEAWRWYYEVVGKSQVPVVDTYWQTETGGHVITNIPGVTPMKPGSCTLGFYGIDTVVLDPHSGEEIVPDNNSQKGVMAIRQPWPGMARTCLGDHERYLTTYFKPYPGYYFTGDSVLRDADGYHFIIGRVDDVLNVSGHRIGTAEVESALVAHEAVAQAAVVGKPHDIKGQSICAFCMVSVGFTESDDLLKSIKNAVRTEIGGFAAPDLIVIAPSLPMTRSGKIMRRLLRKIVAGETDSLGDTSTLADPSVVDALIAKVEQLTSK